MEAALFSEASFSYDLAQLVSALILLVSVFYFVLGVDDLIFDILFWVTKVKRHHKTRNFPALTIEKLRSKPEQRIAIYVPAWHEADVIGRTLDFACRSIEYSNYDIFVGVYPNDPETLAKVNELARIYSQVHPVVNPSPGPTTKAQNLNSIYQEMRRIEGTEPVQIIVLHDVEDIIHPYSLLIYNHLMPKIEMLQLPVFPLERRWNKWTAWTYADEFAEYHQKDLLFREAMGSFVPCAGVGCGFSRHALEGLGGTDEDVFPNGTLTEDYQLGLRLRLQGFKTAFVHQKLSAPDEGRQSAAWFVATRAFFPDTVKTAIRQKTRWSAGICFQTWEHIGWVGSWVMRYTLYRDRKGMLANPASLFGYIVAISYGLIWLWSRVDSHVILPAVGTNHLIATLLDFVLILTLWRLLEKSYFTASLYGPWQGILCLARQPLATLINALAMIYATETFVKSRLSGKAMTWAKTSHVVPTDVAFTEFRRELGQMLLADGKVSEAQLAHAVEEQRDSNERLGETLTRLGYVQERDIVAALADQLGCKNAVGDDLVSDTALLDLVPEDFAHRHLFLPLRVENDVIVVAVAALPDRATNIQIRQFLKGPYAVRLTERKRLSQAIDRSYLYRDDRRKPLGTFLVDRGYLTRELLEDILAHQGKEKKQLFHLLVESGALASDAIVEIVSDYFGINVQALPEHLSLPAAYARIPARVLRENEVIVFENEGRGYVAAAYPLRQEIADTIGEAIGAALEVIVARRDAILSERVRLQAISAP